MATSRVPFAHVSEAELARIFDFYRISWQYEPRSFPIAWNEQGHPVEFFTPDFYLPEYDLYRELTVAKLDKAKVKWELRRLPAESVRGGLWQLFFDDPHGGKVEFDFDKTEQAPAGHAA